MDKPLRASRRSCSPGPLHLAQQLLDVGDRRVLEDAMPEIEDVRAVGESVKDALDSGSQWLTAGDQRERIDVALDGQSGGQLLRRPDRIDCFIEANSRDSCLASIGIELAAGSIWEADHRYLRISRPERAH